MEAGINADQNFYRRPFPQASEVNQVRRNYEEPQQRNFDQPPPAIPPKVSLVTNNIQGASVNGYAGAINTPIADEFYRDYRGVQSSHGYNDNTNGMLSATSVGTATRQPPSTFRSNGNGTTPKHPTISASRNALKPSYRSASAPLDERLALGTTKSTSTSKAPPQPTVKDLLKRFDQNNEQTTPASRKLPIRTPLTESSAGGPGYIKSRNTFENQAPTGQSRAGMMTRDTGLGRVKSPTGTRTTQRSRFATEDQHSNNTLSSIPRNPRSRQDVSGNTQASQSMVNLSPIPPPKPSMPALARRPLFGEVVPEESGPAHAGYGIADNRARRISDGDMAPPSWRQRSQSDADVTPASPTSWYRSATGLLLDELDAHKTPREARKHNRSQSDFAVENSHLTKGRNLEDRDRHKSPPPELKQPLSPSRLPVSSKRLSSPCESASPSSTRSNSPPRLRNQASTTKPQKAESRPWSPAGRATTSTTGSTAPANRSTTPSNRSTTPTHKLAPPHGSSARRTPSPAKISTNNSSLKAYIAVPPPKTSPPLRSSRPRLPVSSATTASSRSKVSERPGSPPQQNISKTSRNLGNETRSSSRTGLPGPIDYAARRERIQRAYSKSIQESEEKELRTARLRRLAAEQAAKIVSKEPDERNEYNVDSPQILESPQVLESPQILETPLKIVVDEAQSPKLEVQTSFLSEGREYTISRQQSDTSNLDSPTLGIPGSFPSAEGHSDEDDPHSAISNATGFTEFDNEPQTEPALPSRGISNGSELEREALTDSQTRDSFVDGSLFTPNENGSIQIILDTTSVDEAEATAAENGMTGSYNQHLNEPMGASYGYEDPVFTSTSPMETLEEHLPMETSRFLGQAAYEEDHMVDTAPADNPYLDHSQFHNAQAPEHPKKLPPWESEQPSHSPTPFSLPTLETTLDNAYHPELVQTPVTEIDYESSDDMGDVLNSFDDKYDKSSGNTPPYRSNHESAWTDYTVNTIDEPYLPPLPLFSNRDEPPRPPPKEEYTKPEVPPKPPHYSPLPSPRSTGDTPRIASPSRTFKSDYSFNSERRSSEPNRISLHDTPVIPPVPAFPDYSPPPPPQGAFAEVTSTDSGRSQPTPSLYNRRPVSSVYRSNRDSESRRESNDDLASSRQSESTPLSSTQISLNDEVAPTQQLDEPADVVLLDEEDKEAAAKLAKRLQHRGRIIKELIDTEAVYLKDMCVVEEIYKGTAEACPKLELGDVKTIFRNTDQIIAFSTMFLDELKAASVSVYSPRQKSSQSRSAAVSPTDEKASLNTPPFEGSDLEKDLKTRVGEYFGRHLKEMQTVYTDFLKSSEQASARLATLQADPTVKVWLNECNECAKDLTAAWDLDALLIKPVQRITRYQLLLKQLLEDTPDDHPDYQALQSTYGEVGGLLKSIDDLKKRIDTVNKIVGRKRKESDVRSGLAKAFGRSREKSFVSSTNRPADDEVYLKLHEKFCDDYLRLQVVLRDVEFYTRQANTYVNDFLRYLSAIELVMRVSASPYHELESKWARFNMSMRDMGTVALEDHTLAVRKQVIEPFEQVIKAYGPPDLYMKKRKKRRLDYERYLALKAGNKKTDDKLTELVEQYEALNETLKFELPKLSTLTEKIGNMCLIRFVSIQVQWYSIWQEKVKTVLEASEMPKDIQDIVDKFNRDYKYHQARILELGIANGTLLDESSKGRLSHSTTHSTTTSTAATKEDDASTKSRAPPPLPLPLANRSRQHSINSDHSPSLPTPDFAKRHSGQFTFSPIVTTTPALPQFSTREFPPMDSISRGGSGSPSILEAWMANKPYSARPSARLSYDSGGPQRTSLESGEARSLSGSAYYSAQGFDNLPASSRPFSGLFHSAMPTDDAEESRRSSRASSRERGRSDGYNILYLAASLFEFQISATKTEAGYPYLTYGAGEIFDVIGEKGELWLAKNQDDPTNGVGWIWSKHFARLAAD